jgi:DNA-binding transcriptional regulator YiaG
MSIAAALKSEISRIARKEMRAETEALKKASAGHRRELAALKKRLLELERQVKKTARQAKTARAAKPDHAAELSGQSLRFSATRFAAQRKKLGLSAANFASLLGVSSISVYNWESGKTRPRQAQLEAIAAARKLRKKEAAALLEQLGGKS